MEKERARARERTKSDQTRPNKKDNQMLPICCRRELPFLLSHLTARPAKRCILCSFFCLLSYLATPISSYDQYDYGAHTAERSSDASELHAVRQATQGMGTKLLLFPKLRTVWFSGAVVLRFVPVVTGKIQSRWGPSCSILLKISKSDSSGGESVICDSAQRTTWVN